MTDRPSLTPAKLAQFIRAAIHSTDSWESFAETLSDLIEATELERFSAGADAEQAREGQDICRHCGRPILLGERAMISVDGKKISHTACPTTSPAFPVGATGFDADLFVGEMIVKGLLKEGQGQRLREALIARAAYERGQAGAPAASRPQSSEEAKSEIRCLQGEAFRDPDHPLMDKLHPEHQALVKKMNALYAAAYGR